MRTTGNYKHGGKGTRLYTIWKSMRERCACPKQIHYTNYGGKGIKVCPEWNDFAVFRDWAYRNGYTDTLTIDRIDVDGDYCPKNCRWATYTEQANNKSNSVFLEAFGEKHTYADWARIKGIEKRTLWNRIKNLNWPIEKALTVPVGKAG